MPKHAYLLIVHNEFEVLKKLVKAIDDVRNDIYIHFDAKVCKIPELKCLHANIFIISQRIDVRWADYSMVQAELALIDTAVKNGPYCYYHLLSGVDFPLKSQDAIHHFFEKNNGKEFIDYCTNDVSAELKRKMGYWHLFPEDFKNNSLLRFVKRPFRALFLRLQILCNLQRNQGIEFKKGSQWCSITHRFALFLLSNQTKLNKTFTHTFCPDEVAIQTLCWNSPFRKQLYNPPLSLPKHMRMIDWNRGLI